MQIPILVYHSISDESAPSFRRWAVTPRQFDEQMRHLRDQGFRSLIVSDLALNPEGSSANLPSHPVVVTFDDGFADFLHTALPIMERYGIASTLYISTGYVGGSSRWLDSEGESHRPILDWAQIREVHRAGVECGAHTVSHPELDTIPLLDAREEITRSRAVLEECLGAPVRSFAYPHGYFGARVRAEVRAAGFTTACAMKHAMSSLDDDLFALSRIIVSHDTDIRRFDAMLTGDRVPLAWTGERVRTRAWRVYRRTRARVHSRARLIDSRHHA